MPFAARVKLFRTRAGLSQMELAAKCGHSQGWVGNIESGQRWNVSEEITRLAGALGVHPGELFDDLPQGAPTLDPVKLASAVAALRQVSALKGWEYDPETHPEETIFAYQLACSLPAEPSTAQVIDFNGRLAERLRARSEETTDGRSGAGKAAGGTHRGRSKP